MKKYTFLFLLFLTHNKLFAQKFLGIWTNATTSVFGFRPNLGIEYFRDSTIISVNGTWQRNLYLWNYELPNLVPASGYRFEAEIKRKFYVKGRNDFYASLILRRQKANAKNVSYWQENGVSNVTDSKVGLGIKLGYFHYLGKKKHFYRDINIGYGFTVQKFNRIAEEIDFQTGNIQIIDYSPKEIQKHITPYFSFKFGYLIPLK